VPDVDSIEGLPPAVALQQQRGSPTTRSSVGSVTTISNSLRMLYSRAGTYPRGQGIIYADGFSPNTPAGACPVCHGLGRIYDATEASMVDDRSLSIRERAISAWPPAWHGQNLRDILTTLGHDVDVPWKKLPKKTRDWILYTDEQPVVPVYAGFTLAETKRALRQKIEPSYMGTFSSARRYVLHTFATTQSPLIKKRVSRYLLSTQCPTCGGKRLRREALSVKFAGLDIGELSQLTLSAVATLLRPTAEGRPPTGKAHPEQAIAAQRIAADLLARIRIVEQLGLGYLTLERSTPTLSPGELQRLRLATQIRSHLFGVVYVLDEPSAGLHPADARSLLQALDQLKRSGNTLFVVEHEVDVIRHADWIIDVGPGAGEQGGRVLYSGEPSGLEQVPESTTRRYLFGKRPRVVRVARKPSAWLRLRGVARNNLRDVDVDIPLGVFTTVTGVSGSGKSSLVSQALVELLSAHLGQDTAGSEEDVDPLERSAVASSEGAIVEGLERIQRLVRVDQKPIGRTPRSNLATYTGLFDHVRKRFAATPAARKHRYDAGRFSFNVAKGRCETCEGEGAVCVELLFMPSVYAPCPTCHGARYNESTLRIQLEGRNIAQVLAMTVDEAATFFAGDDTIARPLQVLREVGLGYLRLGQPATELSGGEAQRIKLASELQRAQRRGTLYVLDEPTTGLHPADVAKLMHQLHALVDAGNTVVAVEHDMSVAADGDWVIDMGPGAGDEGGKVVVAGPPGKVAKHRGGKTAAFLVKALKD
jgi:excinuclease ABC subunit A